MPAPTVVTDFLECVRKSAVVDPKRLEDYLAQAGDGASLKPAGMAEALVRDGLLTRFQADQLLRGRWRNFTLCDKYVILEPLGAGGMGTVYLCSHKIMRRPVAIKVLPVAQAEDPGSVERFHREAQAVAQLRHPNIVGAHDVDKDGKFHFLVMEYVDGVSLQDLVRRTGPLDPLRAAHYMHQAALGLEHAHEAGLVHRDIKPANLLVDRAGVVKILDLGLARFFRDTRESVTQKYDGNAVLGTADYLAPEQAVDSHNVDIRCDIYSLGITFYFLLVGRSPFQDGSVAEKLIWHQVRQPQSIREIRPEIPEGLAAVLEKMIAKDPGQRYQTPAELAEALAPWTQTPIDPPSVEEIPQPTPGARIAGVSESNYSTPRTPVPNSPTPGPSKPASSGRGRAPAPVQQEVSTRKDGRTSLIPAPQPTMKSIQNGPTQTPMPAEEWGEKAAPPLRRSPLLIVGAASAGVLVLSGIAIALGLALLHSGTPNVAVAPPGNPETNQPPNQPLIQPPNQLPPVPGVSVTRGDDGFRVKTAKYEALLGTDGCLSSLTIGGVEFLRTGEPVAGGKSIARGAYFYSEKPPHEGAVQMSKIEPSAANKFKASGDKFSVTYEFTPDALILGAVNSSDDTAPFFLVFDSISVANLVNGKGEVMTVPARGSPDPKWATTTWAAGRSALKVVRTDPGDTKLLGPFGQAKSQIWQADVGSYQTGEIRLEPSVLAAAETPPAPPPGGVLITRQGGARRVRTDLYEAVVEGDGCMPSLRVDGVEFFKAGVGISRGAYFHQAATEQLPDVAQVSLTALEAAGKNAAIRYDFGPDKLTWSLQNKTNATMAFYIVFDPAVIALKNDKDEWVKTPTGKQSDPADAKWGTTTWYAGRARITIKGGSKIWGPWELKYQVWEATLAPNEKRTVVIETALTTPDEAQKAAATAGANPPVLSELSLYAPLDYQVVQRKTRLQGTVPMRGRVRPEFDRFEARLVGTALDGVQTGQWQALTTTAGARTFDATLPAPAGGWYRLEVRALKDGKEVATSAVEHVGVGEVFVGAGQSNSTNCGQERIQEKSGLVSSFSGTDWRLADDPQPGCHDGSTGGSFWPAFGDAMYKKYKVPIGVASTGHSGTSVNAWEPGGELFRWTTTRMDELGREGFRAVLWHQGESDVGMPPDEWDKKMTDLIQSSRKAVGWDVPWFVAQVSYHNPKDTSSPAIREAQKKLWEAGTALEGPDTDTLTGANRDNNGQGIHFSPMGLAAHGGLWADKVGVWLDKVLAK